MGARQLICHAVAVLALGTVCLAQNSMGCDPQDTHQKAATTKQASPDQKATDQQSNSASMSTNADQNDKKTETKVADKDQKPCPVSPQEQTRINEEKKQTTSLQKEGSQ